jgi:hypothetical protein
MFALPIQYILYYRRKIAKLLNELLNELTFESFTPLDKFKSVFLFLCLPHMYLSHLLHACSA